jgi:hypothetical protein
VGRDVRDRPRPGLRGRGPDRDHGTQPEGGAATCSTRRATTLILRAAADLEEAGVVLADAFLRTDPAEWIRARDKRAPALVGVFLRARAICAFCPMTVDCREV